MNCIYIKLIVLYVYTYYLVNVIAFNQVINVININFIPNRNFDKFEVWYLMYLCNTYLLGLYRLLIRPDIQPKILLDTGYLA